MTASGAAAAASSKHQTSSTLILGVSALVTVVTFVIALGAGPSDTGFGDLFAWVLGRGAAEGLGPTVLFDIRLPRILVAAVCGAALAAGGVLSQGLFRNSLASPSILGTTTGGSLAAALTFYFGSAYLHWIMLPAAAFVGALAATSFIFILSSRREDLPIESLLLAGFAINAVFGSLTSLIVSLSLEDHERAAAVMHWLLGGFTAKGWDHLLMVLPPIVAGAGLSYYLAVRLDVLSLGEDVAESLSLDIGRLKKLAIIAIALTVGSAVSVAGAIPFVGLMVPHLTRLITGPRHRPLLGASVLNGMTLMVVADLVSRTVRAPAEIDVGVLTSLFGAPFFLWLMLRRGGGLGA